MISSALAGTDSSYRKRLLVSVCLVIVSAVTFIALVPTMFWVFLGLGVDSFFMKEVHQFTSPDNRYELVVSRRVNFPVVDIFSPSITARIDLKKSGPYGSFNYVQFEIHEYGELMKPEIIWTDSHVSVENVDYHNEHGFRLRLPGLGPS